MLSAVSNHIIQQSSIMLRQQSRSARWQRAVLSSSAPLFDSVIPKRNRYLLWGGVHDSLVLPSSLGQGGSAGAGETGRAPSHPTAVCLQHKPHRSQRCLGLS